MASNLPYCIQWNELARIFASSCGWLIFSSLFIGTFQRFIHSPMVSSSEKPPDANSDWTELLP